jgi:hypothetical protein
MAAELFLSLSLHLAWFRVVLKAFVVAFVDSRHHHRFNRFLQRFIRVVRQVGRKALVVVSISFKDATWFA